MATARIKILVVDPMPLLLDVPQSEQSSPPPRSTTTIASDGRGGSKAKVNEDTMKSAVMETSVLKDAGWTPIVGYPIMSIMTLNMRVYKKVRFVSSCRTRIAYNTLIGFPPVRSQ